MFKLSKVIILSFLLIACGDDIPTEKAVNVFLFETNDFSFSDRKRLEVTIVAPTANNFHTRAQTALANAVAIQEKTNYDVVFVNLMQSNTLAEQHFLSATASYAPDGGGMSGNNPFKQETWEASATKGEWSEQEMMVTEQWNIHKSDFLSNEGYVDVEPLKDFLSKKLNLPTNNVKEVFVFLDSYPD